MKNVAYKEGMHTRHQDAKLRPRGASRRRAVIVGSGIGGLATAAGLAKRGWDVEILEKNKSVGGRLGVEDTDGFRFDVGPTILLFPEILREVFRSLGENIDEHLRLHQCTPNYRIQFGDQTSLTMWSDRTKLEKEVEQFSKGAWKGVETFLHFADENRRIAFSSFLRGTMSVKDMLSPRSLLGVVRSRSFQSLDSVAQKWIHDPRLRLAFTFQTMYLGIAPVHAPALFGLLASTETSEGVWHVEGGLGKISKALTQIVEKQGGRFTYGAEVVSLERKGKRVEGVRTRDGRSFSADLVVSNMDWPLFQTEVLGRTLPSSLETTSSGLMFLLGLNKTFPELHHHQLFFGSNPNEAFRDLFQRFEVPRDPSFYVANPVASDPTMAPAGKSALYVLVPVPRLREGGPDWTDANLTKGIREKIFSRLERVVPGFQASIESERVRTPLDWRREFNLANGSNFGLSHTLTQVGGFRPDHLDKEVENLFYVGASTQPATGIPNVLLGSKFLLDRIGNLERAWNRTDSALHAN